MRSLLLLVVLAVPLLAQTPPATTPDPAAAANELANITALVRDAAGTEGLPFRKQDPCGLVSTLLALFPIRFGLLPRDVQGYAELQALSRSIVERLEKNLEPLAAPQPPSRPELTWWWSEGGMGGPPWRFIYALNLELAGRIEEARAIAFAPDMLHGGCHGRPYDFTDFCALEARLRADFLVRQGEQAKAVGELLAGLMGDDVGGSEQLLDVEAGWLLEQRGAPDDACLLYDLAIQVDEVAKRDTLGNQLAQAALARLGHVHAAAWRESLGLLWLSTPDDEDHFRGEQALCVARPCDPDSWRLLAIRAPANPGVADSDEVRTLARPADMAQARPFLEWLITKGSVRARWDGLFLLHALDRSASPRLTATIKALDPTVCDVQTLEQIDHRLRMILGRGPVLGRPLDVMGTPDRYVMNGVTFVQFSKAWLDELARPR